MCVCACEHARAHELSSVQCAHACTAQHVCGGKGEDFQEQILSFYHVDSGYGTQVIHFGMKNVYWLSHLAGPRLSYILKDRIA